MTNEEAIRVLETMRTDAEIHARLCGEYVDRHNKKRDALDIAKKAIEGFEILGDTVEQALDKYLDPNLATEIKNEITLILAGVDDEEDTQ